MRIRRYWISFFRVLFETTTYLERREKTKVLREYRAARDRARSIDMRWYRFNHGMAQSYRDIVVTPRYA